MTCLNKIPIEKRICNHYSLLEIEDEPHFFMVCPKYQVNQRKNDSKYNFFKTNLQMFIYLLEKIQRQKSSKMYVTLYTTRSSPGMKTQVLCEILFSDFFAH